VKYKKQALTITALLAASYAAAFALFHNELFSAHDIWHQVARLYHYSSVVSAGQFPPRWVAALAHGYGYPLFFFSYHLPWMLGLPLTLNGVSIFTAMRMLFIFGFIASGFSMYSLLLKLTKRPWASLVSAVLYVWAPYHFLSVYVAAAIGTVYLFALIPLLFLAVHLILEKSYRWGISIFAVVLAGSVLTHLMTLAMLFPFVLVFLLVQLVREKESILKSVVFVGATVLGLAIAAFYLIPLIQYLPIISASGEAGGLSDNFQRYFPSLKQLIYSHWGYGPIVSNAKDGEMSLQIGIAQWLAFFGSLLLFTTHLKIKYVKQILSRRYTKIVLGYAILFLLSIYFMLDISLPFWKIAVKMIALDFPFRLLLISVFSGSVLAGLLIANLKPSFLKIFFGVSLIIIALYTSRNHRKVNMYTQYGLEEYVGAETTTNTYHEYLPITANRELLNADEVPETISNNILTKNITLSEPGDVIVHQFVFPGITAKVNGELTEFTTSTDGLIAFSLPAGEFQITVGYEPTKVVVFSEYLSIAALGIIIVVLFLPKKKNT